MINLARQRVHQYRKLALVAGALALAAFGCGGSHDALQGRDPDDASTERFGNADPKADGGGVLTRDASETPLSDCGASRFGASQTQAQLLLVIDKSGSMQDTPAGFDSDKWSAMKASLASALGAVQKEVSIGLELYPLGEHCEMPAGSDIDVELQPGDDALPLIMDALVHATPSGGTPTSGALARALEYFTKGAGAKLKGEKYVLLATDGGPNCNSSLSCEAKACTVNLDGQCPDSVKNCCDPTMAGSGANVGCLDDTETEGQIKALADAGIQTFVVGIPGSESYAASLQAFALAGGRALDKEPYYYAVDASGASTSGLSSVLGSITSSLIKSCRLQLDAEPGALDQINVQVDGQIVPQSGADGWTIDQSTKPPTIVLQGKTCEHIERDGAQNVTILYGCPTQVD